MEAAPSRVAMPRIDGLAAFLFLRASTRGLDVADTQVGGTGAEGAVVAGLRGLVQWTRP